MRGRLGSERGAAFVRLVLVSPLVLVLALGAVDVVRLCRAQLAVSEAAREAARSVARGEDRPDDLQKRVDALFGEEGAATPTLGAACSTPPRANQDAEVTVVHELSFLTPLALVGIDKLVVKDTVVLPCRS